MKLTNQQKLYAALGAIILFVSIFLIIEIRKARTITTKTTSEPIVAENATQLNISPKNHVLGSGELWVVAYLDLNDSKSRKIYQTISDFVKENLTRAQIFMKHAPVSSLFNDNTLPNKAAWCADQQNKLYPFLDALISTNNLKEAGLRAAATATGLNIEMWWACTNGEKAALAIGKEVEEAKQLGLGKPPLIFINNKKISTSQDYNLGELLRSLITE